MSRWHLHGEEDGILALATAIAISAVLVASGLLAFQVAGNNQSDSLLRRAQAMALDAAEGGLNRSYQAIQSASGASTLPCGTNAESESLTTRPAKSSYSTTINYYDTFPVTDAALSCSSVHSGSATPVAAEVIATGTTGAGTALGSTQYMEGLVKLTVGGTTGTVFDDALFSDATMIGVNNPTVDGHNGNDGNFYTNGSVVCGNSFSVQGNVTAQGSFTGANNCNVAGNLTTVGNITIANSTSIGGNVTSTGNGGCLAQGSISLVNNASIGQSAYAYCSITLLNHGSVAHQTVPNDTTLTNPAQETFPQIPEPVSGSAAATAWSAAGYTNQITDNNCAANGVYQDISNMSTATTPTIIVTSCALTWLSGSVSLNANLAIFSTGGFDMALNMSWQSTNSTTRDLYLIVPSSVNGNQTGCLAGQPGITMVNNTSFANTINVLDYTPCTVLIGNNNSGYGQIYGGTVDAANNFTLHYVPLPNVPGATGGGQQTSVTTIAVVYERQLSSLSEA